MAALAIVSILTLAGFSMIRSSRSHARQAATDLLESMIEQARVTAITSRSQVILAIVEPRNFKGDDTQYRLGIFKVESWPEDGVITGTLLNRWKNLETGVVLIGGEVNGLQNLLDSKPIEIEVSNIKIKRMMVHAIAFNSRGRLQYPPGSAPLVLCIAEGSHRNGRPVPDHRAGAKTSTKNEVKICRVSSRCYRLN